MWLVPWLRALQSCIGSPGYRLELWYRGGCPEEAVRGMVASLYQRLEAVVDPSFIPKFALRKHAV